MADVFTIDDLNALAALTAADEFPVWDSEESGEPTKKITAQNMANSVKSLASLPNTTEMNNAIAQSTADVIRTGDVVNSLTSTLTDKPLSAAQGKALNDKITSLIHTNTYSETTDNTGDIGLNLSTSSYVPIAFKITGGNISKTAVALFFNSSDSAKWWVKFVSDENVSNITNATVEGTLYYIVL